MSLEKDYIYIHIYIYIFFLLIKTMRAESFVTNRTDVAERFRQEVVYFQSHDYTVSASRARKFN